MKTKPIVLCLLSSAFCLCAQAQYSIDWSTIDGGGGTSTGGVYSVTGAIGQADAGGPMTNGQYSVTGGFWALPTAVQTPGAPYLWVVRTTTNTVCVWWPVSDPAWTLQARTDLVSPGGSWATCTYQTNGPNCCRIEDPPVGSKFYRLRQP